MHVRIEDKYLHQLIRLKLNENACRNRGFVLDGYPRTFKDAQNVFLEKQPIVEGEDAPAEGEEAEEGVEKSNWENSVLITDIAPQSVIQLECEGEFLKQRVRELPEEKTAGTHWNDEGITRRLKAYKDANGQEGGDPAVHDFFRNHGIEVQTESAEGTEATNLEAFRAFIERDGRTFHQAPVEEETAEQRQSEEGEGERRVEEEKKSANEDANPVERDVRARKEAQTKSRLDHIKDQERDLLDSRS